MDGLWLLFQDSMTAHFQMTSSLKLLANFNQDTLEPFIKRGNLNSCKCFVHWPGRLIYPHTGKTVKKKKKSSQELSNREEFKHVYVIVEIRSFNFGKMVILN